MSKNLPVLKKDKESELLIENALKSNVFLQRIVNNARVLRAIINAMSLEVVNAHYLVTESGKLGDKMFVCAQGSLNVYTDKNVQVGKISPGDVFGEMAFVSFSETKFNVRAEKRSKLWVLNHTDYSKILNKYFRFSDEDYVTFFRSIPLFRELTIESLLNIREIIRVECYPPRMPIIREGDEGSQFFIITGGTVMVSVTCPDGREKRLKRLQFGDFFGEGALLENEKRKATVTAEVPGVECMVLDRENFSKFLGDLELVRQAIKRRAENTRKIVEYDMEYSFVELSDLEVLAKISDSKFGYIELVKYESDPELVFALKILKKSYVSQYDYIENVYNEKNILMNCKCPFIVRLYKTFKNKKFLYYLTEACLGGDLKYLMSERKYLDESVARFIAACIIEAFDYLHERDIVYLNLKPENLVFDSNGYIKLVGFGNARRIGNCAETSSNDTRTLTDFEVYDRCHDYRDLGCLIYEMLAGRFPFQEDTSEQSLSNETIKNFKFPSYISAPAKLTIRKLWKQKPNKGLDQLKSEINEIKNNQWFQGFDWPCLQDQTMKAPYIPRIQNKTDLSNFAQTQKDKETPPDDCGEWDRDF